MSDPIENGSSVVGIQYRYEITNNIGIIQKSNTGTIKTSDCRNDFELREKIREKILESAEQWLNMSVYSNSTITFSDFRLAEQSIDQNGKKTIVFHEQTIGDSSTPIRFDLWILNSMLNKGMKLDSQGYSYDAQYTATSANLNSQLDAIIEEFNKNGALTSQKKTITPLEQAPQDTLIIHRPK